MVPPPAPGPDNPPVGGGEDCLAEAGKRLRPPQQWPAVHALPRGGCIRPLHQVDRVRLARRVDSVTGHLVGRAVDRDPAALHRTVYRSRLALDMSTRHERRRDAHKDKDRASQETQLRWCSGEARTSRTPITRNDTLIRATTIAIRSPSWGVYPKGHVPRSTKWWVLLALLRRNVGLGEAAFDEGGPE